MPTHPGAADTVATRRAPAGAAAPSARTAGVPRPERRPRSAHTGRRLTGRGPRAGERRVRATPAARSLPRTSGAADRAPSNLSRTLRKACSARRSRPPAARTSGTGQRCRLGRPEASHTARTAYRPGCVVPTQVEGHPGATRRGQRQADHRPPGAFHATPIAPEFCASP